MNRVFRLLKSTRLTIYLLILLTLSSVLGMLIPQQELFPESYQAWSVKYQVFAPVIDFFQLANVFESWWFICLSFLFLLNLVACTIEQFRRAFQRWQYYNGNAWVGDTLSLSHSVDLQSGVAVEDVAQLFTEKGYKVAVQDSSTLVFVRGKLGFWGSPLFHVGLVIIVVAAFLSGYFKMNGYMMLGEGETRQEAHEYYNVVREAPLFGERHGGFALSLLKQDRYYNDDYNLDYVSSNIAIQAQDGSAKDFVVEKGKPATYGSYRIFHYDNGFAPLLTITKESKPIVNTFLLLNTVGEEKAKRFYINGTSIPQTDYKLDVELYPHAQQVNDKLTTLGEKENDPIYVIKLYSASGPVFSGLLKPNETVAVQGFTIGLGEMRYWTGFEVVKDPGAMWLFLGGWIALGGLICLYLFAPSFVVITWNKHEGEQLSVVIKARSFRYQRVFKEDFDQLVSKITEINKEGVADVG